MAKLLDGGACNETPDKLADECQRGQQRGVKRVEGVRLSPRVVGAELSDETLRKIEVLVNNYCCHRILPLTCVPERRVGTNNASKNFCAITEEKRREEEKKKGKSLTWFARTPPKLPVSYPNNMSPTSRQKHEKSSIGVTMDHPERCWVAIVVYYSTSSSSSSSPFDPASSGQADRTRTMQNELHDVPSAGMKRKLE